MSKLNDLPANNVDPDEIGYNNSSNETFESVLAKRLSRRSLLRGGAASAAGAFLGSFGLSACGGSSSDDDKLASPNETLLGFNAVAKGLQDQVIVPAGYTASVVYALGDPLRDATPAFNNNGADTDFENRAGDHHDGMDYFGLSAGGTPDANSSDRGLLAMNHEATSQGTGELPSAFLHTNGGTNSLPRPTSGIDKEIAIHGISVVEVKKGNSGTFSYVRNSTFNRRITPLTPVHLSGTVKGNSLVVTKYSNSLATGGNDARGTINNCGAGKTPWGTLISGEENWSGYFTRSGTDNAARNDKSVTSLNRYGRTQGSASRHGWETGGGRLMTGMPVGISARPASLQLQTTAMNSIRLVIWSRSIPTIQTLQ